MISKLLSRLLVPFLLLLSCIGCWFLYHHLVLSDAISQPATKRILSYILQSSIWLASAFFISRFITSAVFDLWLTTRLKTRIPTFVHNMLAASIAIVAFICIISFVFGYSVTGLWATSGVISIVLGFALRSMIADIFTGLAINIEQTYKIGEWIVIENGLEGCVEEINWRTTSIRTIQNNIVRVPNSNIGVKQILNYSYPNEKSRFELHISLDYSVDVERARRVLVAAAKSVVHEPGFFATPEPKVILKNINEIGIEYEIQYWIKPWRGIAPPPARNKILTSVIQHLRIAGIAIAYPKQDVFHQPLPERHFDPANNEDCLHVLTTIELFSPFSQDELAALSKSIEKRQITQDETIIEAGKQGASMYILVEGLLEVFVDTLGDGQELRVAQLVPGQFFGEQSLLTGATRSATVKASTSALVYKITHDSIMPILQRRTQVMENMSMIMAQRQLRNSKTYEQASKSEQAKEKSKLSKQVLNKMKKWFSTL